MAGDNESRESQYRVLVDRCLSLEASHQRLREELDGLLEEKRKGHEMVGWDYVPGFFASGIPYRSVLECMGHAVYVCTASSGEIIYWNRSAENLYGWKDYDVLGQKVAEVLTAEEYYAPLKKIMERLSSGQSWSGQFPLKKRSGESFMAIVTKSPLYEDGELVGVITVSSDAAIFNSSDSENLRTCQDRGRVRGLNLKKIQWHQRPQIAPVPQIASSVSNLASKLLMRRHEDDPCNACVTSRDREDTATDIKDHKLVKLGTLEEKLYPSSHNGKSTTKGKSLWKDEHAFEFAQPSKIAAKVLAKLQIRGTGISGEETDGRVQQKTNEPTSPRGSKASTSNQCVIDTENRGESPRKTNSSFATKSACSNVNGHRLPYASEESCGVAALRECNECFGLPRPAEPLPGLGFQVDVNTLEPEVPSTEALEIEDERQRQPGGKQFPSLGESTGSHGSSSSKGDNESSAMVDCEIQWEDLNLGEEIGRGSFAVVYRGIWNGSDVAIKVYFGNEYSEGTLQDYQKEIDIMKKLRHPNVLLFMGAVYSHERLAIVTEFLPRGSLFKTLHKNNQALDIRRRLRMALDVARGMNYLHHRNPPIVHRDLKSSNLLVDRNWNVKVGDFGLSKWKNATFLTAKSGRGTPQWMAPEVLRNEPSNEKSDVFSFGVILWELMTVSIPWNDLNSLQIVGVVGFMDRRLDLPEGLDPEAASLIRDCWQSDPVQRPSFEEIIRRMTGLVNRFATASVRKSSGS